MTQPLHSSPKVGVFDSGVGGLSVLRAMLRERTDVPLHYVADAAHAPYGEREPGHTIERSLKITQHLVREGARVVVVACNTATACAIDTLRERFPEVRFVGVEPGLKPAAQRSRTRRIGVMATTATINSARFRALVDRHAHGCTVTEVACPGLAAAIELGEEGHAEVHGLLDGICRTFVQARVDTVVLGCTHYTFVTDALVARLGAEVQVLDTADAISRQALGQWSPTPVGQVPQGPTLRLETTGEPEALGRVFTAWMGFETRARHVDI